MKFDMSGEAELRIGGAVMPVVITEVQQSGGPMSLQETTIQLIQTGPITEEDTMAPANSIHISTSSRTGGPPPADNADVRATVADVVREALGNSDDIDNALVIKETRDNDGPMGGRSSSVLAYVTLKGEAEPVAVAINVYADAKIAAKAEERLDELEAKTALADRLDRVKGLL